MQETWVQSVGQEDPLEKEMATHSSILAWEIAWTEEPGGLQSMGLQRMGHDLVTKQQQWCMSPFLKTHHQQVALGIGPGEPGVVWPPTDICGSSRSVCL